MRRRERVQRERTQWKRLSRPEGASTSQVDLRGVKLSSVHSNECWGLSFLLVSRWDLLSTTDNTPHVGHPVHRALKVSVTFSHEQLFLFLSQTLITWRGTEMEGRALNVSKMGVVHG